MRLLACILILSAVAAGCAQPEEGTSDVESPLASPEGTLGHYIDGLRRGDLPAVQLTLEDGDEFFLPGPLPIDSFQVIKLDTLDEFEAAARPFVPRPAAGDVELDVRQFESSVERLYTYHLRQTGGEWRIYSHSVWGADAEPEE